ncbi:MAG: holo-ACP synthase [Ignavibacteria bacterium]|nr:holo-ACP synthase [Ignavibacteria bacterium]
MIIGIGIDIIEIIRIQKSIERFGDHFINKIFTKTEIEYCKSKPLASQHYAVRFAAKEAVYKAFSNALLPKLTWTDIEVVTGINGNPEIAILHPDPGFKGFAVQISLSHSENYAVCSAIVMKITA